jgi:TRAP-type uncharacterized transport system substrate-binding protein
MSSSDWMTDAKSIAGRGATWLWSFSRTHWRLIISVVVTILVINMLGNYLFTPTDRTITIYVSAPGTSDYRIKDKLANAVRSISSGPEIRYRASVVSTPGSIDIENRLKDDGEGRSIGVIADMSHAPNLKTLLPLDWDYVHILGRVGFLDGLRIRNGNKWPSEFSHVVPFLRYGRVFAGSQDSGTLDFATNLFDRYKRDPVENINDYLAPGISNWEQAEAALKAGGIDLAFYCGPIGATTVQHIADDGAAVLLGIKDVQSALSQDTDLALVTSVIPKNSYRASPLLRANWLLNVLRDAPPLFFCDSDIPTLAARRLIVTSNQMSTDDAYLISGALDDALTASQDCPANTWKKGKPQESPGAEFVALGIPPHQGADWKRQGVQLGFWWKPSSWTPFWRTAALGLASILATAILHSISRLFVGSSDETENSGRPAVTDRPDYDRLGIEINADLVNLDKSKPPLSETEHERWNVRVKELRDEVNMLRKNGRITTEQMEVLLNGIRELEIKSDVFGTKSAAMSDVAQAATPASNN